MATEKRLDLIDRKALGIGYCNPLVFNKSEYAHGWNSAIEILMKAPTVDAVEVVHGRWIEKQEAIPWCEDDVEVYTVCSVCESYSPGESNYCPNCGAKMDGDGNA